MPQKTRFGKMQHEWIFNTLSCMIQWRLREQFEDDFEANYLEGHWWRDYTQEEHQAALEELDKQVQSLRFQSGEQNGFTLDVSLIPGKYHRCIKLHLNEIADDVWADNLSWHEGGWPESPWKSDNQFEKFGENLKAKINALDWNV